MAAVVAEVPDTVKETATTAPAEVPKSADTPTDTPDTPGAEDRRDEPNEKKTPSDEQPDDKPSQETTAQEIKAPDEPATTPTSAPSKDDDEAEAKKDEPAAFCAQNLWKLDSKLNISLQFDKGKIVGKVPNLAGMLQATYRVDKQSMSITVTQAEPAQWDGKPVELDDVVVHLVKTLPTITTWTINDEALVLTDGGEKKLSFTRTNAAAGARRTRKLVDRSAKLKIKTSPHVAAAQNARAVASRGSRV